MKGFGRGQQVILLAIGLTVLTAGLLRPLHSPFCLHFASEPCTLSQWAIEITGPVCHPGIYVFNKSPTTSEVIQEAGGIETAASPLPLVSPHGNLSSGIHVQTKVVSETLVEVLTSQMSARKMLVLGIPISVNQVAQDELALVPGVSQTLASRMVALRENLGGFQTWHDLERIKGVGPRNLKEFQNYLRLGDPFVSLGPGSCGPCPPEP